METKIKNKPVLPNPNFFNCNKCNKSIVVGNDIYEVTCSYCGKVLRRNKICSNDPEKCEIARDNQALQEHMTKCPICGFPLKTFDIKDYE